MKILIHDYAGHAFPVQLSRSLAARGHEVLHVYANFLETPRGVLVCQDNDPKTFNILGIGLKEPFQKHSYFKRHFQEKEYGRLFAEMLSKNNPDVIISGNTPTSCQKIILEECEELNIPFVFWVQDIYGIAVKKILHKKIPILGDIIGNHFIRIENNLFKRSDKIVVISEDFTAYVAPRCGSEGKNKIVTIENWSPIDDIPLMPKENYWSTKNNIHNKKVFLYSGTLGMKHNPDIIVRLAVDFKDRDDTVIIVISEGIGADYLKEKKSSMGFKNLEIMNFQPFQDMPAVLASADVLIGVLEADAGMFSVPSKVLTYMCSGKPILLSVPEDNLSAKIIKNNFAGLIALPDEIDVFSEYAKQLISDDELRQKCGNNARKYAEEYFDINKITDKFEQLFSDCTKTN